MVSVVDYDIPTSNPTKRVDFYYRVHRLLRQHYGKDVEFSSTSCYFTDVEALAQRFWELAGERSKRCNLYKAVKMK